MIIQLVVYWILLILKKNYRLIAADLSKKALDADSGAIQQLSFYWFSKKQDNNLLSED